MVVRPISSSSTTSGWKASASICSTSTSRMNFSFDAVSPPSSQPAAWMMTLHAAEHRAEEAHHGLVHRLGVDGVRRVRGGGAVREADVARELPARERSLEVLRRAEGRRARLHVDVRGERAVDDGGARPDDLGQRHPGERLGVLERQRACERDRRHRACERERRDHRQLPGLREVDQPHAHRDVELPGRVAVDDGVAAGGGGELVLGRRRSRSGTSRTRPRPGRARGSRDTAPCPSGSGTRGPTGGGETGPARPEARRTGP